MVYRELAVEESWDLIPARRTDRIRVEGDSYRMLARRIILTETIVRTPNLGIFL